MNFGQFFTKLDEVTKVRNIEFLPSIKVVSKEKDENSEDKGNKLILLDLRDSMWEGRMWERRDIAIYIF